MSKFISLLLIFFFYLSAQSQSQSGINNNARCASALSRYLAPYANLPERQGAFEHFQLRSQQVGLVDLTYWDDTRDQAKLGLHSRHIFLNSGTYQCHYPSSLKPEDLVFDSEALSEGRPDILKRNRMMLAGAGINCRKTDIFPSELLNTYISWMPQLYGDLLTDKSLGENWSRVAGNYSPQNLDFNGFKYCRSVPGPYGREIDRKMPRLEANWASINGQGSSTNGVSGVRANNTDSTAVDGN